MKKIFLLATVAMCALASMATDYTGNLKVTVNGTTEQQNATITLDPNSGKYNLLLKNFVYKVGSTTKNIGNIAVDGIAAFNAGVTTMFYASANVNIGGTSKLAFGPACKSSNGRLEAVPVIGLARRSCPALEVAVGNLEMVAHIIELSSHSFLQLHI